jgi:hypothetical protein
MARKLPVRAVAAGVLLAAAGRAGPVRAQASGGYGDYLAWEDWSRVAAGEHGGLASSWDRSGGHFDANQYESPPGLIEGDLDVVARTITGPGIVYRFWMPHFAAVKPFVVRMYFDGEAEPRIESDSGQILGGAYSYFAEPLVNTFAGGQVCYEPIPFRESLRIETRNRANLWHWYQYSFRTFPPGTDVTSWTGTLDPAAEAARLALVALFQNVGSHPAGESATAVRDARGPTVVPPGGEVTLADLAGPGVVRRLTLRMDAATDAELDSLRLEVRYDHQAAPAIDAPVGWFFGAGHDRAPYRSLPLGTDSPDGFYCYWPMPFHEAVRVALRNTGSGTATFDSAVVEHEPKPVGSDAGYLRAAVHSTIRGLAAWNVMASVSGAGHFVGNFLYVEQSLDSHLLFEGDDLVVVDAADSLHGTGMEDAYNGGSYYNWVPGTLPEPEGNFPPFAIRPLCGILRVDKTAQPPFARADQYRWRIADRVPFRESLEVATEMSYALATSRWNSVVFWYQLPTVVSGARAPEAGRPGLALELRPSVPGPVAQGATIRFAVPRAGRVVLELVDVGGRRVETILDGARGAGPHEIVWARRRLPGGVYFVRLEAGGLSETRKLVLAR